MGTGSIEEPLSLFVALAAIGMLPLVAVMATSFTKIQIVLILTRSALGVQQAPPSLVINALALILTAVVMAPVAMEAYAPIRDDVETGRLGTIPLIVKAVKEGHGPLVKFLNRHAHERERAFFINAARKVWPAHMSEGLRTDDLLVLVPAFVVSQLNDAFIIGMIIYLAFIVIDFIVAGILLSLGMAMISPTVVSVPFKLVVFVAVGGWSLLLHNLVLTYR